MKIDDYRFGSIRVEGHTYASDVIISPDGVNDSWWRERGHEVCPADLEPIWEAKPEILIVGTGAYGEMRVVPETVEACRERGIEVAEGRTGDVVERFNNAAESGEPFAACFHLTC